MCDRNVKSEYILIKLCALVFEYICERNTKFHEKILFDRGVINIQTASPNLLITLRLTSYYFVCKVSLQSS